MLASNRGHLDVVRVLIKAGADVKSSNHAEMTSLHFAVYAHNPQIAKELITSGADLEAVDAEGETALHYAVEEGNVGVAKIIVEAKADVHAINKKGETAWGLAIDRGSEELVTLLGEFNKNLFTSPKAQVLQTESLSRAEQAMSQANALSRHQKLAVLDGMMRKLEENKNDYGEVEFANIMKTLRAADHLIRNDDRWEKVAQRIQNSRKNPPTDTLTAQEIDNHVYVNLKIICHAAINDEAPVLRSFGSTFVSGLMAARELGLTSEFLKYAVSGEDICLEARARSAATWIENSVFASVRIDVDPNRDNFIKASQGYVEAFKETQLLQFYNEAYKNL